MKLEIISKGLIYPIGSETMPPQCHASTTVKMGDGRIAAAWFAGKKEKNPDVRIWFSVLGDGGWAQPWPLTPDDGLADWNPTLYSDPESGRLTLVYKAGLDPRKWFSLVMFSDDFGRTWTEPADFIAGQRAARGPVKNKMIRLSSGRLIAPASDSTEEMQKASFFDISDDNGKTWSRTDYLPEFIPGEGMVRFENLKPQSEGATQPTVWEYPAGSGRLKMFARSSFGKIYTAFSEDFGTTWSGACPTELFNNNSGIDAAMTQDGILTLVYNPVEKNWGPRSPLRLSASADNGETWFYNIDLETQDDEFSYPSVITDGDIAHICYTYKRKSIMYARVKIIR